MAVRGWICFVLLVRGGASNSTLVPTGAPANSTAVDDLMSGLRFDGALLSCYADVRGDGEECWTVQCGFFASEAHGDTTCEANGETLCCADDRADCCELNIASITLTTLGGLMFFVLVVVVACGICGCCPLYDYLCCAPDGGVCVPDVEDVSPRSGVHGPGLRLDGAMCGGGVFTVPVVDPPEPSDVVRSNRPLRVEALVEKRPSEPIPYDDLMALRYPPEREELEPPPTQYLCCRGDPMIACGEMGCGSDYPEDL